eukprot:NODE_4505_length_655_cov_36.866337_g3853_i0.p3 GENE.NODE_4505_length_655_cov_36.866337_g3853_i0~~NODE_4505_length_655_cov_36.866337_g3853_i0.p3  ORF type:complete len:77 (-),score=15.02 NODE_4505_length_655_cov_36.866337_g3853_i0:4-234(-)
MGARGRGEVCVFPIHNQQMVICFLSTTTSPNNCCAFHVFYANPILWDLQVHNVAQVLQKKNAPPSKKKKKKKKTLR